MASPAAAERATGYIVGGISPLGGKRALPTFIDRGVLDFELILFSAGRRGRQVELAPADLIRLAGAKAASIATE